MNKFLINLIFILLNYTFIFSSIKYEEFRKIKDEGIHTIALSPDGKYLATSSFTTLKIWDCNTGESKTIEDIHFGWEGWSDALNYVGKYPKDFSTLSHTIQSMAFSPDNNNIAYIYNNSGYYQISEGFGSNNYHLIICDVRTRKTDYLYNVDSNDYPITYSNYGKYLACGLGSIFKIFDMDPKSKTNMKCLKEFDLTKMITSITYSPDDKSISVATMGNSIRTFNVEDINKMYSQEFAFFSGTSLEKKIISYSEYGTHLICGYNDKISILDTSNRKVLIHIASSEIIKNIGFLPKSGSIFSLTKEGKFRISSITITSLGNVIQLITNVNTATASKDGKYIAILLDNSNIYILQI